MLILLSPAKTLSFNHTIPNLDQPSLLERSAELINTLRTYSHADLKRLMKLSDSLAQTNLERYQSWRGEALEPEEVQNPALLTFHGDVYRGLNAAELSPELLEHAQTHLRILSGLYGVLKPLDHIEPHRLEMGTRLPTQAGKRLYDFWGDTLLDTLEGELSSAQRASSEPVVINLASQEYFGAVSRPRGWSCPVVTPVFRDEKAGKWKVISVFAKRARGLMARHLIEHSYANPKATTQELLRSFKTEGYVWSESESDELTPVYLRAEVDRA